MSKQTKKSGAKEVIINSIDIRQAIRTNLDIQNWRNAITSAENITFPQRAILYDIYNDILLDAHLASVINKRKLAVTNIPVTFTDNGEENQSIIQLIRAPWFPKMLSDVLDSRFWGYTLLEFQEFLPDEIRYSLVPRKHVVPEKNLVTFQQSGQTGINYQELPYYNYTLAAGDPKDLGILMIACQYVIYKRNGFADFAQFCEIFGIPLRIGKYDPFNDGDRQRLTRALQEAGSAQYMTIPNGTEVDIKESGNLAGGKDLHKAFIDQCNEELSKLILGGTLTTVQGEKGARSLGDVHMQEEDKISGSDRRFIIDWLNYEFKWLLQLHGYPVGKGEFQFDIKEDLDLSKAITIDVQLKNMGLPMGHDYLYKKYGVEKPEDYDKIVADKAAEKEAMRNIFQKQPPQPQALLERQFFNRIKGFFSEAAR